MKILLFMNHLPTIMKMDVQKSPKKITEHEMLNAFSVVKNGLRQQINIPDVIFIKLTEVEIFYENTAIYKNNSKQN